MNSKYDIIYRMELDKKRAEVLKEIVREYIETGDPVSSERVSHSVDFPISPATVRNYMAELSEMGYLVQPHASSGRVPTSKGFRFFVDETLKEKKRVKIPDLKLPDPEKISNLSEALSEMSKLISRYTKEISLVVSPNSEEDRIRYVHFFLTTPDFLFSVIVTTFQTTEAILLGSFKLDEASIRFVENFLNEKLKNLTVKSALKSIRENNYYREDVKAELVEVIVKFYEALKAEYEKRRTREIFVRGISNLLTTQIQITEEKVKFLLDLLEERDTLEEILGEAEPEGERKILIGEENKLPELWDYSLITVKYSIRELEGTLGLLGPIRMDYIKGIFVLEEIAERLEQLADRILE